MIPCGLVVCFVGTVAEACRKESVIRSYVTAIGQVVDLGGLCRRDACLEDWNLKSSDRLYFRKIGLAAKKAKQEFSFVMSECNLTYYVAHCVRLIGVKAITRFIKLWFTWSITLETDKQNGKERNK